MFSGFSNEIVSKIENVHKDAGGSLSLYLLQDRDAFQSFLDEMKREIFFSKENGVFKKLDLKDLQEKIEWLERNVDDVLEEENPDVLTNADRLVRSLLKLRVYLLIQKRKVMGVLYFLGYYFDRSQVPFVGVKGGWDRKEIEILKKYQLPLLKVVPEEGQGTLGAGFDIRENSVKIYADNPYVHAREDILNFIVVHEVGHYYFTFLRELFYVLQEIGERDYRALIKAVEKNVENYRKWVQETPWGGYINLFEDFRIEKLMHDAFKVSRKHMKAAGEFLLEMGFKESQKMYKELKITRPDLFLDHESRRLLFIDLFGIHGRLLVFPEVYSVPEKKAEHVKEVLKNEVLAGEVDEEFFEDFVKTARKYCEATTLAEGVKVLESFFKKWFPGIKEKMSSMMSAMSGEKISGKESLSKMSTDDFVETMIEEMESFKETLQGQMGESMEDSSFGTSSDELSGEEEEEEGEGQQGESGLSEEGAALESEEETEESGLKSKRGESGRSGEDGEDDVAEGSGRSEEGELKEGGVDKDETEGRESLEDYARRFERALEDGMLNELNEVEKALEKLRENLKHHGKELNFRTDGIQFESFRERKENEPFVPGAGVLNSIKKWFDVKMDDVERFFLTSPDLVTNVELLSRDPFFALMKKHYLEGMAFARRVYNLCQKRVKTEVFESEEGGRLNPRSYVRERAKIDYQRSRGMINTSKGRFFLREEDVEVFDRQRKIDVVIDASGSMGAVVKSTLQAASFLMGISDGLFEASKSDRFFFRFFAVKGEEKDYLFNFMKFLKDKKIVRGKESEGKYSYHGLFLLRLLNLDGAREGFSAYVEPFLKRAGKGAIKKEQKEGEINVDRFYEDKPFLTFVVTDGHFVSQKDWELIGQMKDNRLFLTCGLYCTDNVDSQVVKNLSEAFDGYFVSNLVSLKGFVEDFLKTFFRKRRFGVEELKNAVNKLRGAGVKHGRILDFSY